jgi:hypothetical protein
MQKMADNIQQLEEERRQKEEELTTHHSAEVASAEASRLRKIEIERLWSTDENHLHAVEEYRLQCLADERLDRIDDLVCTYQQEIEVRRRWKIEEQEHLHQTNILKLVKARAEQDLKAKSDDDEGPPVVDGLVKGIIDKQEVEEEEEDRVTQKRPRQNRQKCHLDERNNQKCIKINQRDDEEKEEEHKHLKIEKERVERKRLRSLAIQRRCAENELAELQEIQRIKNNNVRIKKLEAEVRLWQIEDDRKLEEERVLRDKEQQRLEDMEIQRLVVQRDEEREQLV